MNVGMHEAKTNLSRLVERALEGEEVILTRRGKPAVRLVPERAGGFASLKGVWAGRGFWIADDFDELPDDIAERFGMLP